MLSEHLLQQAQDLAPRIVALRRAIHAEPEHALQGDAATFDQQHQAGRRPDDVQQSPPDFAA